jgi:hypothetical protein
LTFDFCWANKYGVNKEMVGKGWSIMAYGDKVIITAAVAGPDEAREMLKLPARKK